jgi:hypothetical protein
MNVMAIHNSYGRDTFEERAKLRSAFSVSKTPTKHTIIPRWR